MFGGSKQFIFLMFKRVYIGNHRHIAKQMRVTARQCNKLNVVSNKHMQAHVFSSRYVFGGTFMSDKLPDLLALE
jgi:hypothetical protein